MPPLLSSGGGARGGGAVAQGVQLAAHRPQALAQQLDLIGLGPHQIAELLGQVLQVAVADLQLHQPRLEVGVHGAHHSVRTRMVSGTAISFSLRSSPWCGSMSRMA
ncbi:MAG: hypothetical protein R3F43_00750 [bacterium]